MTQKQALYRIAFFVLAEFFFIFMFSVAAQIIIAPGYLSTCAENTIFTVCQILGETTAIIYALNGLKMLKLHDLVTPVNLPGYMMVCLIIFTVAGIFGADVLTEALSLPDWGPNSELKSEPFAMTYICVIAPVLEEIIYRAIILGYMLRHSVNPVSAILISAVIFGLSHFNPAQIPITIIAGILLGVIYWKTGSLILPIIIHIANNTASIYFENMDDVQYIDLFGDNTVTITIAILCVVACVTFYWLFIKRQ